MSIVIQLAHSEFFDQTYLSHHVVGLFNIHVWLKNMSLVMRKPAICICENKDADQLRSNCTADQRLCFRYIVSTIPLPPKSEISSL